MIRLKNSLILSLFSLIFIITSCSTPTETPKGDLTGNVQLEGETDHSGIIIALYDLAYLDTTIVRINNQYPQIGVHINQHTEFDHRLQSPIKSTGTLADGSFELTKISTGTYNLVAMKFGFGFKYIYKIEINEGENEISQARNFVSERGKEKREKNNSLLPSHFSHRSEAFSISRNDSGEYNRDSITLYEEVHISGNIADNIVVAPDHHLIIDDDTVFIPGSSLTIHPGAVIRINPGIDLTIHGTLTAQGEENNMFWVTSNDGFENSQLTTHNSKLSNREDIALYNSFELTEICNIENDLITRGKWDYANTCLLNKVNSLHMQNGIFRNGNCGFYSTLNPTEIDSTFCTNILFENLTDEGKGGLFIENSENGYISQSIFINNYCGALVKDRFMEHVENNYFSYNNIGLKLLHFIGYVNNNEMNNNDIDIQFTGNMESNEPTGIHIEFNNLYSNVGIRHYLFLIYAYQYYSGININNNNFENNQWFIKYYSRTMNEDIDATSNYFDGLYTEVEINNRILDNWETGTIQVLIEPWFTNKISNAGIQ